MTLILSGTNGLSDVDGSASTPAIRGTDSNTGIFFPAADTIAFAEGGAEAMRIDSAGNVGIGTSSPSFKLQVSGSSLGRAFSLTDTNSNSSVSGQVTNGTNSLVFGINNSAGNGMNGGGAFGAVIESSGAYPLAFVTNATERARIDSSGNLLVGAASFADASNVFRISGSTITSGSSVTTSRTRLEFNSANGTVGSISTNGTATTYSTSSDYRLKENITPITGALVKVALLKPCTYTWKSDGSSGEGFIAHELQEVVPDAVVGEKDAVNEDGSIKPQGIDTSFLVATLTAAIQELKAELDTAKARIAALEAA